MRRERRKVRESEREVRDRKWKRRRRANQIKHCVEKSEKKWERKDTHAREKREKERERVEGDRTNRIKG